MPAHSPRHAKDAVLVRLGAAIREVRRRQDISQEQLALETEIDRSYLGAIERGEQNVGVLHLWKICRALRIDLAELMAAARL